MEDPMNTENNNDGPNYYEKVKTDAIKNLVFYGISGSVVIWLVAKVSLLTAKILFGALCLVLGIGILNTIWLTVLGLYLVSQGIRESRWTYASNAVRIIEAAIDVVVLSILARLLWTS